MGTEEGATAAAIMVAMGAASTILEAPSFGGMQAISCCSKAEGPGSQGPRP